ncbi:MAG TPA: EAL domain-containing protein [Thermoanaerobaculia bacterium]|nr:EAL domain-containing protein [Thermoanaerobaculia bacterium]
MFSVPVAATFVAQIAGAAVMAALLFGFYRQYGKSYLLHWTWGWASLAVYQAAFLITLAQAFVYALPGSDPGRVAVTFISGLTAYLPVAWFVFGVREIVQRRPVRLLHAKRVLIAVAAFGGLTSLAFIGDDVISPLRFLSREGVKSLVATVAFVAASLMLWRVRKRREGIGFTLLSTAFFLYAIDQLVHAAVSVIFTAIGEIPDFAVYIGYADFLLQSVIAIGMTACLLEDEREAAELASVEIEHLAYHDALTGLPNRPLFIDRLIVSLAQASRTDQKVAVFFLDLDRFKDINDSLGHSTGDVLLKAVAERIRRCVREGDTVARFGGDEFTLLVPRIENVEDAAKIGQKILETLRIPFMVMERELFVSASIGISIYPTDGHDAETLVRNADTAMYRAKDSGRDNYQLYAPAMNARALERLALENMLRKALANDELVLFYQPVVNVRTRSIVGLEALIRWKHPDLGLLSPAHFISVAELSGLIIPIGEWVLRSACRQLRSWHRKIDPALTMSVNLSALQFSQPDLVDLIRSVIDDTGIPSASLQLEITESNAMQNAENTIHTLRELKSLGVRIAMDDFGTGYSSLNYLKRFPIDTLKLDQSFVKDIASDPRDAGIAGAVVTMAHTLSLDVVAEGVETEEQLEFLLRQRCETIQGYLFSAPVPIEELEDYAIELRRAASS